MCKRACQCKESHAHTHIAPQLVQNFISPGTALIVDDVDDIDAADVIIGLLTNVKEYHGPIFVLKVVHMSIPD